MRLAEGTEAPDFDALDSQGQRHRLADYRGARLLLSFHRYAACPMCNLHIHELTKEYPTLSAAGLQILAVFLSDGERLASQFQSRDVPFPMIADKPRQMYRAYGIEYSLAGMLAAFVLPRAMKAFFSGFMPGKIDGDTRTLPADFLIGPDLVIQKAFYSSNITQHMPLDWIREFAVAT